MEPTSPAATGEQPAGNQSDGVGEKLAPFSETPSALDNFDRATLLAALEMSESGTPDAEPAAPAAAFQETPAQAEVIEGAEATHEQAPPATSEHTTFRNRISARGVEPGEAQQAAAALDMLRTGKAATLAEAVTILTGGSTTQETTTPAATQESPAPATTQTAPPVSAKVSEIKDSIKALREERRAAKADYQTDLEVELTEKIEDAQLELLRAEQAQQVQAVADNSYNQQFAGAADAVEAMYPDLADEDSAMSRILDDRITAAQARQDPALRDPNFIKAFAAQVAQDLGIQSGSTTRQPLAPAPNKASRPVGSGLAPGHQTVNRPTQEQLVRAIHDMPIEELTSLVCTE